MFKDEVLEFVSHLMCNDFQYSVGMDSFDHTHVFIRDGYNLSLEINSVNNLTTGKIVPMVSVNYYTLDMNQAAVFTLTHEVFYSNNGNGKGGHFNLNERHNDDKLIEHGYTPREIEIIREMRFSINIFISKQQ